jgi:hypothetical protein
MIMNLMSLGRAVYIAHSINYRIVDKEIDQVSTMPTNEEERQGW